MIATKKPGEYDAAVMLLTELRALAEPTDVPTSLPGAASHYVRRTRANPASSSASTEQASEQTTTSEPRPESLAPGIENRMKLTSVIRIHTVLGSVITAQSLGSQPPARPRSSKSKLRNPMPRPHRPSVLVAVPFATPPVSSTGCLPIFCSLPAPAPWSWRLSAWPSGWARTAYPSQQVGHFGLPMSLAPRGLWAYQRRRRSDGPPTCSKFTGRGSWRWLRA